jgi:putative oxygen-independent coproporphyrinogen III oxidase
MIDLRPRHPDGRREPTHPPKPSDLAPAFGIYVHIPFCAARCPYCDFNTYTGMEDLAPAYVEALLTEARMWASYQGPFSKAGSIFFGGGTPTLIDPRLIERILNELRELYDIAPDAEITVESNPETSDVARLATLRSAGVNRVSFGAQSFAPHVLKLLGRIHSADKTREAVHAARAAGFDNFNLDLIYGTPGESVDDWRRSLDETLALEPTHVSAYALTIEPATAFGADVASGRMPAPDEDDQAAKYEIALDALEHLGHYELSNWGDPSRHNLLYWMQRPYVGLGAGAHSYAGGVRSWNLKNPRTYIERATNPREGEECPDAAEEWLMLRLRLVEGIDLSETPQTACRTFHDRARALEGLGLASLRGDQLTLTRRGMLLESEVAVRLGGS